MIRRIPRIAAAPCMIDHGLRKILMATTMKAATVEVQANTDATLRRLASAVVLGVAGSFPKKPK